MKQILLLITAASVIILSGCGLFGEKEESKAAEEDPMEKYATLMTTTFNESNKLLNDFNHSLDKLYAEDISDKEFGRQVKGYVPRANEIATNLDQIMYDVDEGLYEYHRKVISLLNYQHQMILDAVEMVNNDKRPIDKQKLRNSYVEIKETQATLLQELKQTFQKLGQEGEEKD
ncbi:hypothetical protein [Bacillus piscicola]|uniref:hypothetical protein n=1 Tax=Bacillus piscicola TaxID=1632684 RepID=UPI001F09E7D0|nr:hypothetical protein [Bacillus piscicola]